MRTSRRSLPQRCRNVRTPARCHCAAVVPAVAPAVASVYPAGHRARSAHRCAQRSALNARLRRRTCRYEILPPDDTSGNDPSANFIADSLRTAVAANASSLCVARLPVRVPWCWPLDKKRNMLKRGDHSGRQSRSKQVRTAMAGRGAARNPLPTRRSPLTPVLPARRAATAATSPARSTAVVAWR